MESIQNKYGCIIVEKTKHGDLTFCTYDENGNIVLDRVESRKRFKQICREDRCLARKKLVDLLCNRCQDIKLDVIENLLDRIGIRLYHNGYMLDFYEIFEEIAYSFKEDMESDKN